jgi:hypothetical protein
MSFNYPTSSKSPENPESLKPSLIILLHSDKDLSTNKDELTVIVFEKSASKNSTLPTYRWSFIPNKNSAVSIISAFEL